MAHLMPQPRAKFFDLSGNALASGKVYFYQAGTTTPLGTFQDEGQSAANTNPVILDLNGEADIWLQDLAYKVVVKDSSDVTLRTYDNIKHNNLGTIALDMLNSDVTDYIADQIAANYDTTSGHRHNGSDSRRVLATDLDETGGASQQALVFSGGGTPSWQQVIPPAVIMAYPATSAPTGWLLCNGAAVSRSTYAALYAIIGTTHGQGDGSTTFNVPDYRGAFLRGYAGMSSITGSGSASSNNATFTAHGVNRTGVKLRISSGTLTGLSPSTDYFAIVVDSNTLAFATSLANALAGTKVVISGSNSVVMTQYHDPDASSRAAMAPGGNSGNALGSSQEDAFEAHTHSFTMRYGNFAGVDGTPSGSASGSSDNPVTTSAGGNETRPYNVTTNFIIKT